MAVLDLFKSVGLDGAGVYGCDVMVQPYA